jgi:hypothetical protein
MILSISILLVQLSLHNKKITYVISKISSELEENKNDGIIINLKKNAYFEYAASMETLNK